MSGLVLAPSRRGAAPLSRRILLDGLTVEQKIHWLVELAIKRCGSAAALARELDVTPPTVSQWRTGRKRPDAIKLICIQDLAQLT